MIGWGIFLGYLLAGLFTARWTFVRKLGTADRFYTDAYHRVPTTTSQYFDAVLWAWLTFFLPPLGWAMAFITMTTPHERTKKAAERVRDLEKLIKERQQEANRLEREVLSYGKDTAGQVTYRGEAK